jgi:hypothetical protein
VEPPLWTRLARLGSLFWRHYLVVATDRPLLLIEHSFAYRDKGCVALPWREIEDARLGWGLLAKPLCIAAPSRGVRRRVQMPRLGALPGNLDAAASVVQTWAAQRSAGQAATG